MNSPLESPTGGTAAVVYGGNTALGAEIYDDRKIFDCVIKDITKDHGLQGAEKDRAEEFTRKTLEKLYDQPMVLDLEAVLRKRITKDEARHILFFPSEDQAVYYQALILDPPKGAPPEHPQRTVQNPHLSLLYIHHWKRWEFLSAFVLAGGMHSLCSLFKHDHPIVRMKAINTLVNITAHQAFNWFRPPPRLRNGDTVEARLHRALLGLRSDPAFISGLIANSWGANGGGRAKTGTGEGGTFPGACLICLELLAMWLSWVRALHTADGTLRLSRPLFRALEEWGGKGGERESTGWGKAPWEPAPPQEKPDGGGRALGTAGGEKTGVLVATTTTRIGDEVANNGEVAPRGEGRGEGLDVNRREAGEVAAVAARGKGVAVEEAGKSSSERATKGEPGAGVRHKLTPSLSPTLAAQLPDKLKAIEISGDDAEQANEPVMAPVFEDARQGHQEVIISARLVTGGEPTDPHQLKIIIEAERKERASVIDLAGKLVADFGRFPPAEQEWKEVVEREKEDSVFEGEGHDLEACASHSSAAEAVPLGQETPAASPEQGGVTTDKASSDTCVNVNDGVKASLAHTEDHAADRNGDRRRKETDTVAETRASKAVKEAGALKIVGNESFRTRNFQAAYDAYATALDALDAARLVSPPPPPPPTPPSSLVDSPSPKVEVLRLSEAVELRGILHRNRAAVALCMFESSAAAAGGEEGNTNSLHDGGKTCGHGGKKFGVGDGGDVLKKSADRRVLHATRTEVGLGRAKRRVLPPGEEWRREGGEEEEKALALLDQCENDCLNAIEIDAADKKAHFRLARCREMRRRCRRKGLAAALGEEKGVEGERRRRERREALMAKILARTEGTHEMVGGAGRGESGWESTPDEVAAATTYGTVENTSRDDVDKPAVEKAYARAMPDAAGAAISGDSDGDDGRERDRLEAEMKVEIDDTADNFGACHAPREGGDLKGTSTPSCNLALADATDTALCCAESTSRATLAGADSGGVATGGGKKLSNGFSKEAKKERVADATRSRSAKMGGARSNASAVPGAARADVAGPPSARLPSSHLQKLRRRLERLTAHAAGISAPSEAEQEADRGGAAAKRVWDFISRVSLSSDCGSASLENLYGDGITADSLVGLVRGLRYACGLDENVVAGERAGGEGEGETAGWSNDEQASKIFLQLAGVKRVSLASAMCSASDKRVMQDVSDHIRRHLNFKPRTDDGDASARPIRCDDGDVTVGKEDARAIFEAAVSALGLV